MSGLDDFLAGAKAFDEGITQFAVGRAISGAKDQMDNLNQSAMNEMERRAELEKISKGLTLQLGGLGAPVSQIQSAVGAVAPKALGTPGAALWEGIQTGSQDLQKLGQQGIAAEEDITMQREDRTNKQRMREKQFDRETALMQAGLRAASDSKKAPKPLNDQSLKSLESMEDFESDLADFQANFDQYKKYIGPARMGSAIMPGGSFSEAATVEKRAKQFFDKYRLAITGAGAGPSELAELQKSVPSIGERPETFLKGVDMMIEKYRQKKARWFDRRKRAGFDVSGFDEANGGGGAADIPEEDENSSVVVKTLKNGQRVKVRKLPNGQWEPVP